MPRSRRLAPGLEIEAAGFAEGFGGAAIGGKDSRLVPVPSPLFPLVPGGANETQGLSGAAHQLHPQKHEDSQVPRLGESLSGQSPAHPRPGAGRLEDFRAPLLCVSGVLPSVHVSGDVTLVSLQSMDLVGDGVQGVG